MKTMADQIVDVVESRDWVTFAELDRLVPGFKATSEDGVMIALGPTHVWQASRAGMEALCLAWDTERICAASSTSLTYLIDGVMLRDKNWVPLTLRPGRFANFRTPSPGNLAFFLEPKMLKSMSRKRKRTSNG